MVDALRSRTMARAKPVRAARRPSTYASIVVRIATGRWRWPFPAPSRPAPDFSGPADISEAASALASRALMLMPRKRSSSTLTSMARSPTPCARRRERTPVSPGFCGGIALGSLPSAGCAEDEDGIDIGGRAGYDLADGRYRVRRPRRHLDDRRHRRRLGLSTTPAFYAFSRELQDRRRAARTSRRRQRSVL